jgi:uncharacterized membrane protein
MNQTLKRILIFLAVIAILTLAILLFAWVRGETTPREPTLSVKIFYYACWIIVFLLILYVTHWIVYGKRKNKEE